MPAARRPGPVCGSKRTPGVHAPGPLGLNDAVDSESAPAIRDTTAGNSSAVITIQPITSKKGLAQMGSTDENDPLIEALNLAATARTAAYLLKKTHPSIRFTSGRRSKEDQARAMAGNVVKNRKWIEETYRKTDISAKCQKWVDDNPDKATRAEIQEGLLSVFNSVTSAELGQMSRHLSGDAFDVQPVEDNADAIKQTIRGLPGLQLFLDKEGGLVRWHAQFR